MKKYFLIFIISLNIHFLSKSGIGQEINSIEISGKIFLLGMSKEKAMEELKQNEYKISEDNFDNKNKLYIFKYNNISNENDFKGSITFENDKLIEASSMWNNSSDDGSIYSFNSLFSLLFSMFGNELNECTILCESDENSEIIVKSINIYKDKLRVNISTTFSKSKEYRNSIQISKKITTNN